MSPLEICHALQDSAFGTSLRESQFLFPLIETAHVLGLALSVGIILLTDLRLIGVAMARERVAEVTKQLKLSMLTGFAVMFVSGGLLFSCEAAKLYVSTPFRIKLTFLLVAGLNALLFETTIGRSVEYWKDPIPPQAKLAGWISLLCWAAVIVFGRWTAYGLG
jgi:hypothetical protein